ncbi:MAG: YeeE/YedE thiosulfate transporter family protein [Bacillota bacterium]
MLWKRALFLSVLVTFVTILGLILLTPAPALADCGAEASSCKVCHEGEQKKPVNRVGVWHTDHAFSDFCASCHLGDKGTSNQEASHLGMRPVVLDDPKGSCEACHSSNYAELAATYKERAEKQEAAAPLVARQLPPPNSNNGLFIGLNIAVLVGLILLVWAWEKGPLARFTVRRLPPMAGGQAAAATTEPAATGPVIRAGLFSRAEWSPYLAGAGLGLVGVLALWLSQQPLGSSGAFMIGASSLLHLTGAPLADSVYFKLITPPAVTWQVMLVLGIPAGAFLSAWLGRDFRLESVPARWVEVFGPARWKRWLVMFLGGMILEFGASIAGGCTSGLAIAGSMQLAGAGFLFIASLFVTGIITAKLMYGRRY